MTRRGWTEAEVRALGVRTDLVTACEAALGVGRSTAYELLRRGELPFPAVRVSPSRVVVPMAGVLAFLGIEPAPPARSGGGAPGAREHRRLSTAVTHPPRSGAQIGTEPDAQQ